MKALRASFYVYLFLSILWFILIIYLMLFYAPSSFNYLPKFSYFDKIIHFLLFFIQSFFILKSIVSYQSNLINRYKFLILTVLILFAIIIEYQHYFISFRTFDVYDMTTNVFGIIVGVFYVILLDNK